MASVEKILRKFVLLFSLLCSFAIIGELSATEIIAKYHSDITIEPDGDLLITETITVVSEGNRIKRGIYRDFPRYNENKDGKLIRVGFDILGIKRDSKKEPWKTENSGNFTRIYIGDKDVFIPDGLHTYEITYRTDRQLRFFESHDELFWNVTGTEWEFSIDEASATVTLPDNIKAYETVFFTGRYGSTDKFATATIKDQGKRVVFSTTRALGSRSGLTIGIKMPAGSFKPVPGGKKWLWIWRDYKAEITSVLVLLFTSLFYFWRWRKVGRDLPAGVIVPRWDTPQDLSPALVNYVDKKGFGSNAWKGLTAALLNLAVKGYVELEDLDAKPTIMRTAKTKAPDIPVGEAALLDRLEKYKSRSITIKKSSGSRVKTMHSKFVSAMEGEHRKNYYQHNRGSIAFGIFFSVVGLIAVLVTGGVVESDLVLFIPIILVGVFGTLILSRLTREFRKSGNLFGKISAIFSVVVFGFVFLSGGLVGLSNLGNLQAQPILLTSLLGLVMLNALFFFLMGAPTQLGREKMDVIAGLKTYLVLAEKDRMNMAGAPQMSPEHYETLLPYAVALGVEKPWSDAFQAWLLTAAAAGIAAAHYAPGWYHGRLNTNNIGDTFGEMANNIESSFTAALPTPKSSSSGFSSSGGGSSGGGGGGGGW